MPRLFRVRPRRAVSEPHRDPAALCYTAVYMERILIHTLPEHIGAAVHIAGSVASLRDHGKMLFIDLRDRTASVQCFIPASHPSFADAGNLSPESAVAMTGTVKERPEKNRTEGVNGGIEFVVETVTVLSRAAELPFDLHGDFNLDTTFDRRPITLRRPADRALFRVQARIVGAFREYLTGLDFTEFQAPAIVGGDAEGGAEVFSVDYFGTPASLATSPQLYKQILVGVFERVFCVGQVFRAEKHSTSRHLNEYTSLDFEMGFITDHTDVMAVLEGCMRHIVGSLARDAADAFALLNAAVPAVPDGPFPVMTLAEAQKVLADTYGIACEGEPDLAPEHEKKLCEYALGSLGSDFIFVTHYPIEKRPMYVYEDENAPGFTKSFDLLFRGVEICSGGQRIHEYGVLCEKIRKKLGADAVEKFGFYLQAFKYGLPPHGGMAVGLERLTAKMLGIANAKEAAVFPRDRNRIDVLLRSDGGGDARGSDGGGSGDARRTDDGDTDAQRNDNDSARRTDNDDTHRQS